MTKTTADASKRLRSANRAARPPAEFSRERFFASLHPSIQPNVQPIVSTSTRLREELTSQISLLAVFLGLMWLLEIVDQAIGPNAFGRYAFDQFGIVPRTVIGLRGILSAPFLHGNFSHLLANTVPFFTLGWLVMLRRTQDFVWVTLIVMGLGGFGTWLIADLFRPPSNHVGASILIFGYLGFLMLRGYFERRPGAILLSVTVVFSYGGLLLGLLPRQPGISWEGHLSGLLAGIVAARLLAERSPKKRPSFKNSTLR